MITKQEIKRALELMGIAAGDTLLLHSAMTAIGGVEGGADTVIDAFLEVIDEEGTLVMSTLTGWFAPFDAATSPSAVGYLSEVFRTRPGVLRSLHPVHSVCAYGKNAKFITEGHENCKTGCGEGTPYLKIRDLGGKALLLGVDMDRNTVMHSLEEAIDARYLRTLDIVAPTYLEDYQNRTFTLEKFPPGHRDFMMITPYLRRAGAMTEGKIGKAVTKCIDMQKLFAVVMPMLEKDPLLFICHNDHCNSCHWSRLLYTDKEINMDKYKENYCTDPTCEICVI